MSEVSIVKSRASVMLYNNDKKAWEPAEGIRGMSYVQVYHHEGNNAYRIVGRSMTDQQVVVINCALIQKMKYNAATPTFHQWRDQRQVYGLNFHSKDDAAQFKDAIDQALDALNNPAHGASNFGSSGFIITSKSTAYRRASATQAISSSQPQQRSHTQQYVPQNTPKNWQNRYPSQNDTAEEQREPEKPKMSSSVTITPATPVAPTPPAAPPGPPQPPAAPPAPNPPAAPPAPAVPAAPGAPPAPGGVPAPPPPPPPPSAGGGAGGGGGGSLAEQIAAAKLKKSQEQPKPEPKQSSSGSSGPFGGDMMAEMQRKLAARKAKDGDEPAPVRNHLPPVEARSESRTERLPSANKLPKSNPVPPPTSNHSPGKPTTPRQDSGTSISSSQLQELKMEILSEFRKDLEAAKADIIQAVRQELSRSR